MLLVLVLGAVLVAAAAAVLPSMVYLRGPDVVSLGAGILALGAGLVLLSSDARPPAGQLTFLAGVTWFLPDLAASGVGPVDGALLATALVHVGVLAHAALVVQGGRIVGAARRTAVACGYATAVTGFVGGYQVLLPVTGAAIVAAVLSSRRMAGPGGAWGATASLVLGMGLLGDAAARAGWGPEAERFLEPAHAVWFAAAALLVARAGALDHTALTVDITDRGITGMDSTLAAQLGLPGLRVSFADGDGGWLDADGRPHAGPRSSDTEVFDASGAVVAVMSQHTVGTLDARLVTVLGLAAANARLRRSVASQVEDLAASRRRLLVASDVERQAMAAQLRTRCLAQLGDIEHRLRQTPGRESVVDQLTETRARLEAIAAGIEPLGPDGSLRRAMRALAATVAGLVQVDRCDEPRCTDVARALWFCCAEAASNTAKHAPGAVLRVTVVADEDVVRASFGDDGPGGADPGGAGLRGVRDRVETLGGMVTVVSPIGGGTRLSIVLPDQDNCGQPVPRTRAGSEASSGGAAYVRRHLLLEDVP